MLMQELSPLSSTLVSLDSVSESGHQIADPVGPTNRRRGRVGVVDPVPNIHDDTASSCEVDIPNSLCSSRQWQLDTDVSACSFHP